MKVPAYDFSALLAYLGEDRVSAKELALRLGLDDRTVRYYRRIRWLTAIQADRLSNKVGVTPWEIWGTDWEHDEAALLTRERIELEEACRVDDKS